MTDAQRYRDRYGAALIADAAYRAGVPLAVPSAGLAPLDRGHKLVGPVRTVRANNDLPSVIAAVHRAQRGDVIVISNPATDAGLMGDLIGTDAHRKELGGFVVDGLVRDVTTLLALNLPVFCRGHIPIGPLKLPPELKGVGELDGEVSIGGATVRPGDWVFGDADGVVFVAASDVATVYQQAEESMRGEEALLQAMADGASLGDLLDIETFLEERARNPDADFNTHVAKGRRAI